MVEDGVNGYLCRVRDADDLASKMERMILLSSDERAAMGLRGREKMARQFDERIVIGQYLDTIKAILNTVSEDVRPPECDSIAS